jgi:hypothetical protein
MKLLGKSSAYESILAYYQDEKAETDLTPFEKAKLDRVNEAFTLIRNYKGTAEAVAILRKRFPDISRATAYRDCADAISLFGDISKSTKEGIRHLATEIVRDAIAVARLKNDAGAMIKGAMAISKINGVNMTDPDAVDWAALEPHTYVLGLDPEMLKALQRMLTGGKVDLTPLSDMMKSQAEDAVIISETPNDADAKS